MSRRAVQIEDDFDDETELPLPKRPLPNTGTRGALLRSVDDDDGDEEGEEDFDFDEMDNNAFNNNGFIPFNMNNNARPGPATPSSQQQQFFPTGPDAHAHPAAKEADNIVSDLTPYKKFVFAIYYLKCVLSVLSLQMDMYLSNLPGRETPVWDWGEAYRTTESYLVPIK